MLLGKIIQIRFAIEDLALLDVSRPAMTFFHGDLVRLRQDVRNLEEFRCFHGLFVRAIK